MAAAFQPGRTVREATRKSLVVRASRTPYDPIATVATTTNEMATRAAVEEFTGLLSGRSVVLEQIGEIALDALGPHAIEPAQQIQHRVGEDTQHPPDRRNPGDLPRPH